MLIKLDTFPSKSKIGKAKSLFKKGINTEAKNFRPISLLPLISKAIEEKTIHDQTQDYLQRNEFLYIIYLTLEHVIPQTHVCFG